LVFLFWFTAAYCNIFISIPPRYVRTDIFEAGKKHSSLTFENAEQLILKPDYSDDNFNPKIGYLFTPFKGGLTRNIDTFIDQEVREMVDSIDKAHREYETEDIGSEHGSGPETNDQENNENHDYEGKKRKRAADSINENYIVSYERCGQANDYEENHENYHNDDYKSRHKKKREDQKKKHRRVADDINDHHVHQSNDEGEDDINDESGNEVYNNVCYKCGTARHISKFCSLHSSEYFINMRKRYSSVVVECALRQILDSIGFIFQNNIQR
jgi:hypothetical protein